LSVLIRIGTKPNVRKVRIIVLYTGETYRLVSRFQSNTGRYVHNYYTYIEFLFLKILFVKNDWTMTKFGLSHHRRHLKRSLRELQLKYILHNIHIVYNYIIVAEVEIKLSDFNFNYAYRWEFEFKIIFYIFSIFIFISGHEKPVVVWQSSTDPRKRNIIVITY